jgi:hypothetical protein
MGSAGNARMWFFTAIHAALGAGAGLLGHVVTVKSWNLGPATGDFSLRACSVLLWCVPLASGAGIAVDDLINRDLRTGYVSVNQLISRAPGDDDAHADLEALRGRFTDAYVLHLVEYDLESQYSSTVDVAFTNGFIMRCRVFGSSVGGCQPISTQFETWMDAIVQEGLLDNPGTIIADYTTRLMVDPDTLAELPAQKGYMSETYAIRQETQRGGTVVMAADFTTSYTMSCYFHGATPAMLDRCQFR